MEKQLQIIARNNSGELIVKITLPTDCILAVIEETVDDGGWKHICTLFDNMTEEKKSKMLAHLTNESNENI